MLKGAPDAVCAVTPSGIVTMASPSADVNVPEIAAVVVVIIGVVVVVVNTAVVVGVVVVLVIAVVLVVVGVVVLLPLAWSSWQW